MGIVHVFTRLERAVLEEELVPALEALERGDRAPAIALARTPRLPRPKAPRRRAEDLESIPPRDLAGWAYGSRVRTGDVCDVDKFLSSLTPDALGAEDAAFFCDAVWNEAPRGLPSPMDQYFAGAMLGQREALRLADLLRRFADLPDFGFGVLVERHARLGAWRRLLQGAPRPPPFLDHAENTRETLGQLARFIEAMSASDRLHIESD